MSNDWMLVLIFAFGNIGNYWFAPSEKKREAGVQAFTASLALLSAFCITRIVPAKLLAAEVSFAVAMSLTLLMFIITYLAVGSVAWWIFKKFLSKF